MLNLFRNLMWAVCRDQFADEVAKLRKEVLRERWEAEQYREQRDLAIGVCENSGRFIYREEDGVRHADEDGDVVWIHVEEYECEAATT